MDTPRRSSRRRLVLWGIVLILSLAVILVSIRFTESAPPNHITIATGVPDGAYDYFGKEYQQNLEKLGLKVHLRNTNGSVENLHLLLKGEVDVAFVQGGTSKLVESEDRDHKLRGVAAIYTEPLWVFYRGDKTIDTIAEFKGKRISVGPKDSGSEAVSRELLDVHGIDGKNSTLENLSPHDAMVALKDGKLDVTMMVSSYKDKVVQELMRQKGVQLMSFKREIAYNRRFRY